MSVAPATYRNLFDRFATGVPTSYLQALAWNESRNNPAAVSPTGADGLFQITRGVREDFNRETGRAYTETDMYDPAKCCEVAVFHLNQIQDEYVDAAPAKFDLPYVQAWNERDYVALVTLGYTAGWSRSQGVAMLVRNMLSRGIDPVDIHLDSVIARAGVTFPQSSIYVDPARRTGTKTITLEDGRTVTLDVGPYMSHPGLKTHIERVVNDYFDTAQYWRNQAGNGGGSSKKAFPWWAVALLGGGVAYAAAKRKG